MNCSLAIEINNYGDKMKEHIFLIEGMTCGHCKMAVEVELIDAGIKNFKVEVGSASVECNSKDDELKATKAIEFAGYKIIN